jgi:hypothetical protein
LDENQILAEDDKFEKYGIDRVAEALHANMWDTMTYKTELRPVSETATLGVHGTPEEDLGSGQELSEDATITDIFAKIRAVEEEVDQTTPDTQSLKTNTKQKLLDKEQLDVHADMDKLDDLEQTFTSLLSMRNKAKALPDKERRELAAKVALALFNSFDDD